MKYEWDSCRFLEALLLHVDAGALGQAHAAIGHHLVLRGESARCPGL